MKNNVAYLTILLILTSLSLLAKEDVPVNSKPAPVESVDVRLLFPKTHFVVPGVDLEIIFTNAILSKSMEGFQFSAKCDVGTVLDDRLILNPKESELGDHPLMVKLLNADGKQIDEARTTIRIVPAKAGAEKEISLLIMGDSLTNATIYPNEIANLLSKPGNPYWTMYGTNHPGSAAKGVVHEGYAGWTWGSFNSRWAPDEKQVGKTRSSPFLFIGENEKPELDIGRYLIENCAGKSPDYLTVLLGINDCFHPNPDDPKAVEDRISKMFREADKFLAAFQKESPDTEIGLCLVPVANSRDSAFDANYKGKYTRWGWRRIHYRLVQRQIEHFGNREGENVFLIPTFLVVDPTAGYPEGNGVHPNRAGYKQLAGSIYAWLKWRMSE